MKGALIKCGAKIENLYISNYDSYIILQDTRIRLTTFVKTFSIYAFISVQIPFVSHCLSYLEAMNPRQ